MSKYIPVETPDGVIWVEVDANTDLSGFRLAGRPVNQTFEESFEIIKNNARRLYTGVLEFAPQEVEVSFGIKFGAEAATPILALAKASAEASYTVTMKWTSEGGKKRVTSKKKKIPRKI
jgi:hypothetical protein